MRRCGAGYGREHASASPTRPTSGDLAAKVPRKLLSADGFAVHRARRGDVRLAGLVDGSEFNAENPTDDEDDAEAHQPGEGLFEEELAEDGGECDAGCGPDAIGDAERHAAGEGEAEHDEREDVAHSHADIPALLVDGHTQGERADDLEDDCADEEQPDHHATSAFFL